MTDSQTAAAWLVAVYLSIPLLGVLGVCLTHIAFEERGAFDRRRPMAVRR